MRSALLAVVALLGISGSAFAQGWESPVWQTPMPSYYYSYPSFYGGFNSYDIGDTSLYYGWGSMDGFSGTSYHIGNSRISTYQYTPRYRGYRRWGW